MTSVGELLARAQASIARPSEAQALLLGKVGDLQARLDEGRLRVAALGQFKRGKSSLLNALLGAALLPTGVTPVTAIPTFIRAGTRPRARIALDDDKKNVVESEGEEVAPVLDQFISESRNPHNTRRVASVSIEAPSEFLAEGVILIDTPGVGSTFKHNTAVAEAALTECDAALFVLSADPPITEVEIAYLEKIRRLIPRILFVLNKADLLDEAEKADAAHFLETTLSERNIAAPEGVFLVSSRRGLQAKRDGDRQALETSGLARLEGALRKQMSQQKQAILDVTGRARAIDLIGDLLFQSEFEYKALLTPEDELRRKAQIFEESAQSFAEERQRLSDLLILDRKRLLRDLQAETERIWAEGRAAAMRVIDEIGESGVETLETRKKIARALAAYFEQALGESVSVFREKMKAAAAAHQERAGALIGLVRRTAADLLEIQASATRNEAVFQARREPYWVAPEPSLSMIDASAVAISRLLPAGMRRRRARAALIADTERAALRNVANLDWSLRQNIGDSIRNFERSLTEQLDQALRSTREALAMAIEKRAARREAVEADVAEAEGVVDALTNVLAELRAEAPALQAEGERTC